MVSRNHSARYANVQTSNASAAGKSSHFHESLADARRVQHRVHADGQRAPEEDRVEARIRRHVGAVVAHAEHDRRGCSATRR